MPQARGHIANGVFAPEGALQNVGSADFFGLGYEPGGSLLPGRNYNSSSYRFGAAGGQEKDDEIYGATGTSYTAEYWQYDTRIARRWNLDPVDKPWMSPYHAFSNKFITNIDPNGANDTKYETKDGRELLNTDDGRDIVVTVPDRLVKPMEHFAAHNSKEVLNSPEWNSNMTNTALKMGGTWDRTLGQKVQDALGVVGEMWTDPMMVVGGLSAGVAGLEALANAPRALRSLRNTTATGEFYSIAFETKLSLRWSGKSGQAKVGTLPNHEYEEKLPQAYSRFQGACRAGSAQGA